jgi:hypothetical protein
MNGSSCKVIPVENLSHDSGRALVRVFEYAYPKGNSKHQQLKEKSAATALNTGLDPNGLVVKAPAK